jgi:hypothetical protein
MSVSDAVEASELHVEVEQERELFGWKRKAVVAAGRATPCSRRGPRRSVECLSWRSHEFQ